MMEKIIRECLDEMFRYAQPSISFEKLIEEAKKEKPTPRMYERYYLSQEECETIVEKYIHDYRLKSQFKEHCELLINDMTKGCSKDKYIKEENGNSYRGHEAVPPLSDEIGEENLKKVVDFIRMRMDYYRFDYTESKFRFSVMNYSPCSNKQTVINYWKSKGVNIEIKDRDPERMWEVHNYNLNWDEIDEENEY